MRETRSSGSVEGVMSNRDPYSDFSDHQLVRIFIGSPKLSPAIRRDRY